MRLPRRLHGIRHERDGAHLVRIQRRGARQGSRQCQRAFARHSGRCALQQQRCPFRKKCRGWCGVADVAGFRSYVLRVLLLPHALCDVCLVIQRLSDACADVAVASAMLRWEWELYVVENVAEGVGNGPHVPVRVARAARATLLGALGRPTANDAA